jgi:hypothetical protein
MGVIGSSSLADLVEVLITVTIIASQSAGRFLRIDVPGFRPTMECMAIVSFPIGMWQVKSSPA